eukprot:gene17958-19756_t
MTVYCSTAAKRTKESGAGNKTSLKRSGHLLSVTPVVDDEEELEDKQLQKSNVEQHLNGTASNAATREHKLNSFIAKHKGDIVRLLKGYILPKLKARALQQQHLKELQHSVETDQYGNLDKEAMNYELGYFLGLQKAFKKNPLLGGDGGKNLIPLRLGMRKMGVTQATTSASPMTGFTSVTYPHHSLISTPAHENFGTLLNRYGVKDPGFLKQISKATDGNDILDFAGKNNLDVYAERKNLEGINEYLSKRSYKKPKQSRKQKRTQIPKRDDVNSDDEPSVVANLPEAKRYEPMADVASGPNPLENLPTPIDKAISKPDHISEAEIHEIVDNSGGKLNWAELSGIIAEGREHQLDGDDTPEVGSVYQEAHREGENMERSKHPAMEREEHRENMEPENEERGEADENHEVEKRTFTNLPKHAMDNKAYAHNADELRMVLREIISKLSSIPEVPAARKRNIVNPRQYYYNRRNAMPSYASSRLYQPLNRLVSYPYHPAFFNWRRRSIMPRPASSFQLGRRTETPHEVAATKSEKAEDNDDNEYIYPTSKNLQQSVAAIYPSSQQDSDGVEAFAYEPDQPKPPPGIESYISKPISQPFNEAVALLNRGSTIDESPADNVQQTFLQKFLLPSSSGMYRRSSVPRRRMSSVDIKQALRLKRSTSRKLKRKVHKKNDMKSAKTKGKLPKKKHSLRKKTTLNGRKKTESNAEDSSKTEETSPSHDDFHYEVASKSRSASGAKKQSIPMMSDIANYISPAMYEKSEENFFSKDSKQITSLPYAAMANSVTPDDSKSFGVRKGVSIANTNSVSNPAVEQYGTRESGNGFRSTRPHGNQQQIATRTRFVGGRRVSPAVDIYKDHVVTSGGDSPFMEVKSLRTGNLDGNAVETQGQGSVETSNNFEVIKSPGSEPEAGNFVTSPDQYSLGDVNQDPMAPAVAGEHQPTDSNNNNYAVEEVTGETKQAISNSIAELDKGITGQGRQLEACCTADQNAPCCNADAQQGIDINQAGKMKYLFNS